MQKSSMTTYNVCKYFNDNNIVLLTSWKCIIGVEWQLEFIQLKQCGKGTECLMYNILTTGERLNEAWVVAVVAVFVKTIY